MGFRVAIDGLRTAEPPEAASSSSKPDLTGVEILTRQASGGVYMLEATGDVAGNIAASTQIGSIEFAAQEFGTRLVVVLGHSRCGAAGATLTRKAKALVAYLALRGPRGQSREKLAELLWGDSAEEQARANLVRRRSEHARSKYAENGCADCHIPFLDTERTRLNYSDPVIEEEPFANTFLEVDLSQAPTRFETR